MYIEGKTTIGAGNYKEFQIFSGSDAERGASGSE